MQTLRRSGLALTLLAGLLVSPVAAAKPKKAKAAAGKASGDVARFSLVRPESAGIMNLVPAHVVLEPGSGVVTKNLTHLRPLKKEPGGLALVGGDVAALAVKPGTYSVQVSTPVADQPGAYQHGKAHPWVSPVVKVVLSKGETICLVLDASVDGTEYDGGWTLAKADSPAACESMTQRVTPDEAPPPDAR